MHNKFMGLYGNLAKYSSLSEYLSLAKFFEEGFGLSRIIFTMSKLEQKELALNMTEILQLK